MKSVIAALVLIMMISTVQTAWIQDHDMSAAASQQVAAAVKAKLLANINQISNATVRTNLQADLNQSDDSKRSLNSIDDQSVTEIFNIFGIKNPNCDTNKDGNVSGDELTCLGKIWKYYVPPN